MEWSNKQGIGKDADDNGRDAAQQFAHERTEGLIAAARKLRQIKRRENTYGNRASVAIPTITAVPIRECPKPGGCSNGRFVKNARLSRPAPAIKI